MPKTPPKKTRKRLQKPQDGAGAQAPAKSSWRAATSPAGTATAILDTLTIPARIFVLAYVVNGGNATRAYMEAYPRAGYRTAQVEGSRILAKPEIQRALIDRVELKAREAIASADERDTVLTLILRNPQYSIKERIRAIAELNKATGRHSMTHKHTGTITLEQALSESRS